MTQPQAITPQRQAAAQQVGAVFNSLHEYIRSLYPDSGPNKQLEFAHARVDEAAMWAIKSVLTYGTPTPPAASESAEAPTPPAETPLPADHADGVESF
jgi:hypothetical protein